jgi:lysophospholipase L1-like esterase
LQRHARRHARRIVTVAGAMVGLMLVILLGAEAAVRAWQPQEALGWGERPALQPHSEFGWTLRPSQVTHLRWEGYDYVVSANDLGFPGPAYAEAKPPGALRVLVLGDAFSSAEGVDTAQAWPRLVEEQLARQLAGRAVQVMNFAVTGYGPAQNAAVLAEFGPRYHPDVIVVAMYVNDYEDVLLSADEFRAQIGFGRPDPDTWPAFVGLSQLRQFANRHVLEPLRATLKAEPAAYGYFLAGLPYLEHGRDDLYEAGRARVADHLRAIHVIAKGIGARLIIVLAPAPAQVCTPEELAYFPRAVTFPDDARFDLELPQRVTAEVADEIGVPFHDLRPALQPAPGCPYFSHNLHWTAAGHRLVADDLRPVVIRELASGNTTP